MTRYFSPPVVVINTQVSSQFRKRIQAIHSISESRLRLFRWGVKDFCPDPFSSATEHSNLKVEKIKGKLELFIRRHWLLYRRYKN